MRVSLAAKAAADRGRAARTTVEGLAKAKDVRAQRRQTAAAVPHNHRLPRKTSTTSINAALKSRASDEREGRRARRWRLRCWRCTRVVAEDGAFPRTGMIEVVVRGRTTTTVPFFFRCDGKCRIEFDQCRLAQLIQRFCRLFPPSRQVTLLSAGPMICS